MLYFISSYKNLLRNLFKFPNIGCRMKLIVVRHGETKAIADGILMGQQNGVGLNDKGREQIARVAEMLKDEKIDVAFTSDQLRVIQSANIILQGHDVTVHRLSTLRDRSFGTFEGKPIADAYDFVGKSNETWVDFDFNGGETLADVNKRMVQWFEGFSKEGTILLVNHADPISMLLLHLLKKPISERHDYSPANGEIFVLESSNEGELVLNR
jgi:broad specificity phosphatase PhoE